MIGIDVFAAVLLAAEIDDIRRFDDPKFVSWAGMCPTLYQSDDTSRHGRMKTDSNLVGWQGFTYYQKFTTSYNKKNLHLFSSY